MTPKLGQYATDKAGGSDAGDYYRERQRRRSRRRPTVAVANASVKLPTVVELADHEKLIEIYYQLKAEAGPSPGLDGITYNHLSRREVPEAMCVLSNSVVNGTYAPYPGRTKSILKADGVSHRDLTLRSIFDRVVAKALQLGLEPLWETIFLHRSMAWQRKKGVWLLLAELEHEMVEHNRWVLAVDDIKGAFDNVNINQVMADHRLYIPDPELLRLIEIVLRGGDPNKKVGIDQGSPYSPTALNLRLHHAHDKIFDAYPSNPPWRRYGDNLVYMCQSVPEGIQVLNRVREQLKPTGLTLKGVDGQPRDLLNGDKVQFLGFQFSCRKAGELRLELGPDAYTKLHQHLEEAHEAVNPPRTAQAVIRGWMAANGPALGDEVRDVVFSNSLRMAIQIGFREIASREELMKWMDHAYQGWLSYRERVGRRTDGGYIPGAGG